MLSKTAVTASEVAQRAGVSRSAVSRAFTPGASIAPATRLRVMEAAEALGYQVDHLARSLIRQRSEIVCLIGADFQTPYRAKLIRAMTQEIQNRGGVSMIVNTDRSDEGVRRAVQKAIQYRAEGCVVLSGMPDLALIEAAAKNGRRLALLAREDAEGQALRINPDDAACARQAVGLFLERGRRRLAFANSEAGTPSVMAREAGFLAAAREMGFEPAFARIGASSYESGRMLARRLLSGPAGERPDAVFCATDLLACGFLDEARHGMGLRVPEDLAAIGFDDIEQASWSSYDLATFDQPVEEMARAAADWILRADRNAPPPLEPLRMAARFVRRGSLG